MSSKRWLDLYGALATSIRSLRPVSPNQPTLWLPSTAADSGVYAGVSVWGVRCVSDGRSSHLQVHSPRVENNLQHAVDVGIEEGGVSTALVSRRRRVF